MSRPAGAAPPCFDHIALACRDVEAQCAWYQRVLGFEVHTRKEAPSRPGAPQTAFLLGPPASPMTLELMPDNRRDVSAREPFTRGLSHIALGVEDFTAWEALLEARGVEWLGPAGEALGGGRVRSFPDPEGNMLQIVGRP